MMATVFQAGRTALRISHDKFGNVKRDLRVTAVPTVEPFLLNKHGVSRDITATERARRNRVNRIARRSRKR